MWTLTAILSGFILTGEFSSEKNCLMAVEIIKANYHGKEQYSCEPERKPPSVYQSRSGGSKGEASPSL